MSCHFGNSLWFFGGLSMEHVHEETMAEAEVPVGEYFAAHKDAVTLSH